MLKSIEEHVEFNEKYRKFKKESNAARSLNGYPNGIFMPTVHDSNKLR